MYIMEGKITVTEYMAKFNELTHFTPSIMLTNKPRKKKFMLGLRVDVA